MSLPRLNMDAPLPTVSIISPTPRSLTFSILADSPYSSPCQTPFRPESSVSPSPIDSPNKRRKSSLDVDRRPKKGDEDYIKRPENAFILFRRKCCEERAAEDADGKRQRQADLSKTISQQWKCLCPEERKKWEELAKEKKKEHERLYPDYVYRPQRVKDKDGKVRNKKKSATRGEYEHDGDEAKADSVTFVFPENASRPHGRSASAPNRPYQSFSIPNVYASPSCPASPGTPTSLLPMISRRSGYPGQPDEDIMSDFDFHPSERLVPFRQADFEAANLQSSALLRSMFNVDGADTSLEPLDMQDSLLLPAHNQIISPASSIASGSSGPSTPQTGPFTPTSSLHETFPERHECGSDDWNLGLHQRMENLQFSSGFAWGESTSWSGPMFTGDDFDVNAIPPINLGLPKYAEGESNHEYTGQEHQEHSPEQYNLDESILGFDDMMAGHSF